ncbi:MAG: hypothetical protein WCD44_04275 [Candidatus Babeliales bacterium]
MKQYSLFFILFVFYTQAKIRRPLFKKFVKKRIHQQKIVAIQQTSLVEKKKQQQENMNDIELDAVPLSDGSSAVTYDLNGGRFGDNLSSYCRAIWLAYRHNIPLLYKQFKYSEQLMFANFGLPMTQYRNNKFKERIVIPNHNYYDIKKDNGTLYVIGWRSRIPADWNDKKFVALVKKCIALPHSSTGIEIPSQHFSIAVHIRTGGDYKPDKTARTRQPKRFAPLQFYIDQIKCVQSMVENKKLYVHIFTDDANPLHFVEKIKQELGDEQIVYGCREKNNNFYSNVLEDFFAMAKFDCLIRPESLYSIYAERLGDHKIIIYPMGTEFCREKRMVIIKEIGIKEQTSDGYVIKNIRI